MAAVVSAISGTVVIPGEPAPPLPPFPPDITIKGSGPTTTLDLPHSKVLMNSLFETNHHPIMFIIILQMPVVSLLFTQESSSIAVTQSLTFQRLAIDTTAQVSKYAEPTWPGVEALLSSIAKTIANVQGIIPTGRALQQALAGVPTLEHNPQMLHTNLGDLMIIMKTLHDLSSFLQKFPLLNVLLKPVTESLANEELDIQHLQTDTHQVVGYSNSITSSIKVSKILLCRGPISIAL